MGDKTFVFANWKMYLDFDESNILMNRLLDAQYDAEKLDVAVFPSMLALAEIEKAVRDTPVGLGAQNVAWVPKGAYTGAVSALMAKDVGAQYALVGHSERRHVFGETNDAIRKKLEACVDAGITPVLCIGETAEDLDAGKREYRLKKQLMKALEGLSLNGVGLFVAYEPVWAIGTDHPCDPQTVDEILRFVHSEIEQYVDASVPVLYGGSVDTDNVLSYLASDQIAGVLVGHASAEFESFTAMLETIAKA